MGNQNSQGIQISYRLLSKALSVFQNKRKTVAVLKNKVENKVINRWEIKIYPSATMMTQRAYIQMVKRIYVRTSL